MKGLKDSTKYKSPITITIVWTRGFPYSIWSTAISAASVSYLVAILHTFIAGPTLAANSSEFAGLCAIAVSNVLTRESLWFSKAVTSL